MSGAGLSKYGRGSEAAFQAGVVELARMTGWAAYHTHDSRRSEAGFPDLVLVRERVIFVELKSETGKLSEAQEEWGALLQRAGATWEVWRPADWPRIEQALARRRAPAERPAAVAPCPVCEGTTEHVLGCPEMDRPR